MMKNLLIFLLLQGVCNDTLTFNVMIMLTFPQLNFIIVIMCSLVIIWSIHEYSLLSLFPTKMDMGYGWAQHVSQQF